MAVMTDMTVLCLGEEQGVEVLVAMHCKPVEGRDSGGRWVTMELEMEVVLALDEDGISIPAEIDGYPQ